MASKQLLQSAAQCSSLLSGFSAASPSYVWMRQSALGGMLHLSTRAVAPATPSVIPQYLSATPAPAGGLAPLPIRPKYISSATTTPAAPTAAAPPAAAPLLEEAAKMQYSTVAADAGAEADPTGGHYTNQIKYLHWLMAGGIITCMLLIQAARASKGEQKGYYMMLHKSIGFSMVFLISYRSFLRLTTKIPHHLPGPSWEHWAASISHTALYCFMWYMPMSGILMGYFGGKGIPFFGYTIPGKK